MFFFLDKTKPFILCEVRYFWLANGNGLYKTMLLLKICDIFLKRRNVYELSFLLLMNHKFVPRIFHNDQRFFRISLLNKCRERLT